MVDLVWMVSTITRANVRQDLLDIIVRLVGCRLMDFSFVPALIFPNSGTLHFQQSSPLYNNYFVNVRCILGDK